MIKLLRTFINLILTGLVVLILLGLILGLSGFSDKTIGSQIDEELRVMRQGLSETIRDPDAITDAIEARRAELREFHGLDDPWYSRIRDDTLNVITLDLGKATVARSTQGSSEISKIVMERLPYTLLLMLPSLFIVSFISIGVGVTMATRSGGRLDRIVSILSAGSAALPAWWFGILAIMVFSVAFRILPSGGMFSSPPPEGGMMRFLDIAKHAILPVMVLVAVSIGPYLYEIRSVTLKIAHQDFVTYGRAQGFSEWHLRRVILRVASPVILTGLVLALVGSISGAILTETVFNWPGMGRLYFEAIVGNPDEGLIIALTFVFMVLYLSGRFFLEIFYTISNPRERIRGGV